MPARHDSFKEYARHHSDKNLPCVFSRQHKTQSDGIGCPNWHDALELQLCTAGEGYIIINGKRNEFSEGDIAVINSDCTHYTGSETDIRFMPLIINADFCRNCGIDCCCLTFESLIKNREMINLFKKAEEIFYSPKSPCRIARLQAAVLELLISLRENYTLFEKTLNQDNAELETVKMAVSYIREHYNRKLYLDEIAKKALTDKYRLSRSFKAFTGKTVVWYINEYRCTEASELIQKGSSVGEAAAICGFSNISFFTKIFKSVTGILPSEVKKKRM